MASASCPAPSRAIEPPRVRSPPAHGARTLQSGDVRAAVPRPGHGERTQSENLWQTPGPTAHRSGCTCPRVGAVVDSTSVCPHTWSQELPASDLSSQRLSTLLTDYPTKQHP